jgi:hypothetical protein
LFITGVLGWIFLALIFATFLYFNYSRLSLSVRAGYLFLRIQLVRHGRWVGVVAILPLVLGIISKGTILWPYSDQLTAVGFMFVGVYLFIWLSVVAHVDEEFGDIENRVGMWRWLKTILAVLCLGFAFSLALKQLSITGSNELILIFFSALGVSMYFVGYFRTSIRWLGVICGWVLAMSLVGIEFKILHLSGANEMMVIGIAALIIWTPIIVWKRKVFHSLFIRFVVAIQVVTLILVLQLSQRLEFMIGHRQLDITGIERVLSANKPEQLVDGDIQEGMRICNWYIETYGARPGYVILYRDLVRIYDYTCEDILRETPENGMQLSRVLKMARQMKKINGLFPKDYVSRSDHADEYERQALSLMAGHVDSN